AKTVIRRRRLHVGALERRVPQEAGVHDTVERASAGIGDLAAGHEAMQPREAVHGDLFEANLAGARNVLVAVVKCFAGLAWRSKPVAPLLGVKAEHLHAALCVERGAMATAVHAEKALA